VTANPLRMRQTLRALAAAAAAFAFTACNWFTDFKNQPRVEPWEPLSQADGDTTHAPRGNPQLSVPISGTFAAGYQVSYNPMPGVIDSIAAIATNPTPVSAASLENGRKHYSINCAVCHGDTGQGNGPAVQYGMAGINIVNARVQGLPDGYIYGMIRNGRGLMPTYNRIEELERWDVVNYLRALQGRVPNTAGVGAVGVPGQTGRSLPGASATAPQRPAPFFNPRQAAAPGTEPVSRNPRAPGDSATQAPAAADTQALNQTKRPAP
jgi:mono/diheme cytochrome c family protein